MKKMLYIYTVAITVALLPAGCIRQNQTSSEQLGPAGEGVQSRPEMLPRRWEPRLLCLEAGCRCR